MESVQKISGFLEYLPPKQRDFQKIQQKIQKIFEDFCAEPIATPVVERLETLLKKGGNPKEIYTLGRLEEKGNRNLGLRFDLTLPLARYVVQHFANLTFPFRRYQIQPVWRGERAQKGRYRQFYQCDFDIIGNEKLSIYYDAEVLMLIAKIMDELGVENYIIKLNHRELLKEILLYFSVSVEHLDAFFQLLDKKEKIPLALFQEQLQNYLPQNRLVDFEQLFGETNTKKKFEELEKIANSLKGNDYFLSFHNALQELKTIYNLVKKYITSNKKLALDLFVVRGLEYYTGIVFETSLLNYQDLGSICSGGRYENLASYFGKKKFPGVGFSIGLSRLFDVLYQPVIAPWQNKLLIAFLDKNTLASNFFLAEKIRKIGIETEVFLEAKKILTQIQYAEKKNYRWVAFYGEQEAKKGMLAIKDLQNKRQKEIPLQKLATYFSNIH